MDYYLRVDSSENGKKVIINGNLNGLKYLKDCIESLLEYSEKNLPEDIILMTPENGGKGLTTDTPAHTDTLVEILKISRWE